jgi:hypothetical protein
MTDPSDTYKRMTAKIDLLRETLLREKAELEILKENIKQKREELVIRAVELTRKNRALDRKLEKSNVHKKYNTDEVPQKQRTRSCISRKQVHEPRLWDWKC